MGDVVVTLDGVDVTAVAVSGSWSRRLNRPSTATVRFPMQEVTAQVGCLLKIEALVNSTFEIVHHGRVLLVETDSGEDTGYTVYNSTDPMEMWQWRPVRGDLAGGCAFMPQLGETLIDAFLTGPQIIEAALQNSEFCGSGDAGDCEGPLFLDMGTFAGGGVDLSGAPTDWPMSISELVSLLVSTGRVDIVIEPTDPGGGIMGTVSGYNGDFGTDLSGSVQFQYGTGAFNVRRLRWNEDMTRLRNKIWYYAGPRIETAGDPAGDQHWCFNVQGDDKSFNADGVASGAWASATSYAEDDVVTNGGVNWIARQAHTSAGSTEPGVGVEYAEFWNTWMVPPGGRSSPPASSTDNQLGALRISSQGTYGVRMDIQIFDAQDDKCVPGVGTPGHDLYRYRWQQESWLAAQPLQLMHVTPTRETAVGEFDIGDLVGVEAVSEVRGGFSGAQRVYEYTASWDENGVLELSELQTSAGNEGL